MQSTVHPDKSLESVGKDSEDEVSSPFQPKRKLNVVSKDLLTLLGKMGITTGCSETEKRL